MAVEGSYSGEDQRPLGQIAGVVDEIARGEIVGTVGDEVVAGHQVERIAGVDAHLVGDDADV